MPGTGLQSSCSPTCYGPLSKRSFSGRKVCTSPNSHWLAGLATSYDDVSMPLAQLENEISKGADSVLPFAYYRARAGKVFQSWCSCNRHLSINNTWHEHTHIEEGEKQWHCYKWTCTKYKSTHRLGWFSYKINSSFYNVDHNLAFHWGYNVNVSSHRQS